MSRPLSEIGSTESRRNSGNFNNQSTKKVFLTKESSPFDSSPFANSPRLFWKEQTISPKNRFDSENEYEREPSLSPKRNSIENLKKASRVKNSSMYAREQKNEYDPTSVQAPNRPLAAGRPLSTQVQGNAYGGGGLTGLREHNEGHRRGHSRGESLSKIPTLSPMKSSPSKIPSSTSTTGSPTRDRSSPGPGRMSPTKSSLASPGRFNSIEYNPDFSMFSDDGELKHETPRPLRRHAKSVTFDAAPPVINEYEMVTPDPSSVASGSREGSYETDEEELSFDQDDSFDASLEDTDKTPVVLPEDWRHMSPEAANTSLIDNYDDVFGRDNSPMPNAHPNGRVNNSRNGSTASDGESRPLPPLPGMQTQDRRDSSVGLSAAAERAASRRSLPQLPPSAGISKTDLLNMREGSMSLEDRLRLMNFDDDRDTSTPTQESHDKKVEMSVQVEVAEIDDLTETDVDGPKTPRISRESILRKVQSRNFDERESYSYNYDAESSPERSYGDLADLDPDVPIPSREVSSNFDEHPEAPSEADSVIDAYSFAETTELYTEEVSELEEAERETSVIRHDIHQQSQIDSDDASEYSLQPEEQPTSQSTIDTSGPSTPTAATSSPTTAEKDARRDELFADFQTNDMDLTLDPLKSSFQTALSPLDTAPKLNAMRQFLQRPETPEITDPEAEVEDPGTPDSVIRHPVVISPPDEEEETPVPEEESTIKGAGGKLRARPSLIPADLDMAAQRRQVSGEHPPPVPRRSPARQSLSTDFGHVDEEDPQASISNKENLVLDLKLGEDSNDLSFGLDKEFDNIIEAQKVDNLFPLPPFAKFPASDATKQDGRHMSGEGFIYTYTPANSSSNLQKGYLMRQNTKVVVASSRQFSDEKPAVPKADQATDANLKAPSTKSRKSSAERKPAWTTEPWNPKVRRRSIRTASGSRKAMTSGPVPPLPGQESAVAGGLDSVAEQEVDEFEDGQERGRLFVKVVGVKDLDLPLPKKFELVVLDDLEFQLTLQTKLEPPAQPTVTAAPVKIVNHKKSHSAFRNLLSSPKKRKEQERKQQEEAERLALQQQQEAQEKAKRNHQATAWDLLHDLVGPDGSFARAYVCLKNHENQAYGRPLNVDIPCFNEWAVDNTGASSVKSKRGGVVRRPPYRVGKLALQLLYVPKPKNAKDEDMPKSMNACIRELREAEEVKNQSWEGPLSQQGGDCPYWRRRFFRLNGTKLTAYHEATRQPRATINLAKATKLIDDKSALQQPSSTKSGGRRKSAFAEEEEGYMFVEEGFRIRFANGEVIDFYADSREQKEGWMKVLSECVGKDIAGGRGWAEMVLDKERKEKRSQPEPLQAKPKRESNVTNGALQRPRSHEGTGSQSVPSSPVKRPGHSRTKSHVPSPAPPPIEKDEQHKSSTAPRRKEVPGAGANRRDQVRSMIF
ncbi:Bud site selection protein bud4 [Paraconiothyrium brasiliense]|uniref:Bud site selection protein bud4 n=1 Tax=Paraconiothyrium brasiliense TaxID=300254 RepID=A0ABR3RM22_9PLEO